MTFGLTSSTINKINAVFKTFPSIQKIILFGSRAIGNYKEGSDIDLALLGKELNQDIISHLLVKIDELNTPYLFDIVDYNKINNFALKKHIDKEGKIFYKKEN